MQTPETMTPSNPPRPPTSATDSTGIGDPYLFPRSVLLAVPDLSLRAGFHAFLTTRGCTVAVCDTVEQALSQVDSNGFDAILIDLAEESEQWIPRLGDLQESAEGAQIIVLADSHSNQVGAEAVRQGAYDFLTKPILEDDLVVVLSRAQEKLELQREIHRLRRQPVVEGIAGMVGRSLPMRRMLDLIARVAPTRANVLITGETGTGKELVARAVHASSERASRPFVAINCSALPETLLESELFGHVKGSFTGASQSRRGLFEDAAGGTLFLDEISTISQNIQVKLLRVLQEKKIHRVGGREPIAVDFRLVTATNQPLDRLVRDGTFREDLYFRLNVFPISVPPLRDRRQDIPLLADHFRSRIAEENRLETPRIPIRVLTQMMEYDWPGNVRELENYIERGVIMGLGARFVPVEPMLSTTVADTDQGKLLSRALEESWTLERLEREYIIETLQRNRWHQGRTAKTLGINRRTLYRKLQEYRSEGLIADGG